MGSEMCIRDRETGEDQDAEAADMLSIMPDSKFISNLKIAQRNMRRLRAELEDAPEEPSQAPTPGLGAPTALCQWLPDHWHQTRTREQRKVYSLALSHSIFRVLRELENRPSYV